ncbi:SDR family NAD(P)-dependent oxidoreductase [Paraglaciecola chathamensis]
MSESLSGKIALVTGDRSGLGRSLCYRLAKLGVRVFVIDLDSITANQ